jgi:redox-sensitive bicupin YhaK (pirin superfamily)
MSWTPAVDPTSRESSTPAVDAVIEARIRDLGGGFNVRRVLPSPARRLVGPFVFFDHMGPVVLPPGKGMDVRPHPHINLATVTYLFEGEIVHRDSLGSHQTIRPGDINWMTAGRGIAHSERSGDELRKDGFRLHGLQLWVALPKAYEEREPDFTHHPAATLPTVERPGARIRVLAGKVYGAVSPVRTFSPLFYADAALEPGSELSVTDEYPERAVYVADGALRCGTDRIEPGRMIVFSEGVSATLRAESASHVVMLGGTPLDGPRHIWWNFVSSSKERIEEAKRDWKAGRFPKIPGDDQEFIPLPER